MPSRQNVLPETREVQVKQVQFKTERGAWWRQRQSCVKEDCGQAKEHLETDALLRNIAEGVPRLEKLGATAALDHRCDPTATAGMAAQWSPSPLYAHLQTP